MSHADDKLAALERNEPRARRIAEAGIDFVNTRLRESVSARQVEESLKRALGDALTEFRLFDLYRGKGIDSNEKSVAVGLTFQHPSATLTESEISQFVEKAVTALERDLNARLR